MQDALNRLGRDSRQYSATAYRGEVLARQPVRAKGFRQKAGRGDGVGDRKVDAHTADR